MKKREIALLWRSARLAVWALLVGAACSLVAADGWAHGRSVEGYLESGPRRLGGVEVTLYQAVARPQAGVWPWAKVLGRKTTGTNGYFEISYDDVRDPDAVLYLVAKSGPWALATIVGSEPRAKKVIINDLTSVASAYALAQFIHGRQVAGNAVGLKNAASMFLNLVDPKTGEIGDVLSSYPNGDRNETLATLTTLANISANCVRDRSFCRGLFENSLDMDGSLPRQSWPAFANLGRYPGLNAEEIFGIFEAGHVFYRPVLEEAPNAWTLALLFLNDGTTNGPGNFAIDAEGSAWVINNYQPGGPEEVVCASGKLYRFNPDGSTYPGSPYTGGGLDGAGYGVTFDPHNNLWIGNYGFQAPPCRFIPSERASHNRISKFDIDGNALSPKDGFTNGSVYWPQGTYSDRHGNIWIANCGNGSIVKYPRGDHRRAKNILSGTTGLIKAFDITIDPWGRVWATGNQSDNVAILDGDGKPVSFSPISDDSIEHPMGISSDSRGYIWVSSSKDVDLPCPDADIKPSGELGELVLILPDGTLHERSPFGGGGITLPWGNSIDGKDNLFVANFGGSGPGAEEPPSRIGHFCGAKVENCPQGFHTGDPLSPENGYTSAALRRVTAVQVDPSGNVWATNNWKFTGTPNRNNPGGEGVVVFIGLAAPIKTPLIGPPEQPE